MHPRAHLLALVFLVLLGLLGWSAEPGLSDTRSTPVSIVPTGNTVQVGNSISINPAGNTVSNPTYHSMIQLCTTDHTIANNSASGFGIINCAGYKEIRIIVSLAAVPVDPAQVQVAVAYYGFGGAPMSLGKANWAATGRPISEQANFTMQPTLCAFTVPVMFDSFFVQVWNSSGAPVTVKADTSVIYLVN